MTTDSVSKQVVVEGAGWSIGGMAKGAGMLAPQLATMLVVLTTDAVVPAADLDTALRAATRVSFDRLDSDGCMSTNDTVTVHGQRRQRHHPDACRLHRRAHPGLHRPGHAAAQGRRGRRPRDRDHRRSTPPPRTRRSRSAAASRAATSSRPPSSARTPTGAGCSPASAPREAAFDPADLDVAMNGVWVCRQLHPARGPGHGRPQAAARSA